MPITLNHSNINVQYETGKNYNIETVKSDLYVRNENVDTVIRNNIQTAPVTPTTFVDSSGNVYAVEAYTYSGTANTADYTRVFSKNTTCDILIVGGGGGGSPGHGGGGGAGQLILIHQAILNGTYTINVGKGGIGGRSSELANSFPATKGSDSVFGTVIAEGGGANTNVSSDKNGGSGAGGDGYNTDGGTSGFGNKNTTIDTFPGAVLYSRGNNGGSNTGGIGGGGGGAGTAGAAGSQTSPFSIGGDGLSGISDINYDFKTNFGNYGKLESDGKYWFAGGGGGGASSTTSAFGGKGGGGNGSNNFDIVGNAMNNTGSGGGGGAAGSGSGGSGGSGIVIIRYLLGSIATTNFLTNEPTITPSITSNLVIFNHSGGTENQTSHSIYFPENTVCDILIIGGGGGGGNDGGGGGGGGQVLYYTNEAVAFKTGNAITLNAGTYNISIGNGGDTTSSAAVNASNGQESSIKMNNTTILSAGGGGGGGTVRLTSTGNNAPGGGGGNAHDNRSGSATGGTSSAGGGTGGDNSADYGGGGGGGANITGTTKNGGNATSSITGSGGQGTDIIINGVTYAVGGGGSGGTYTGGSRGSASHGGGIGGNGINNGANGTNGTGGGGGGSGDATRVGGKGGSGIIIIKVVSPTTSKYLFFNYLPAQPTLNYTVNFPTRTMVNFINRGDELMSGQYTVSVRTTQSTITPTQGQNLQDRLYFTSNFAIRYSLLNPILDPIGAQWTYSSNNTNVYHMGRVGIGTTSAEYQLDVRGNIYSSLGGYTQSGLTTWSITSDRRIKENIVKASYEKCLENVKNIELYNFNFKDNYVNTNDRRQLGFIAQEVQQVYPKAVEVSKMILNLEEKIDDLLTLNTTQIDYTLYGAVKGLIHKMENIKIKMEQIKATSNITMQA